MGKLPIHPTSIPIPFAENGNKNNIPENPASSTTNAASWMYGFPDITRKDKSDGGLPPLGKDFQGLFYSLSEHTYYQQSGGVYNWNASLNYPIGAIVLGSNGTWYRALKKSGPNVSGVGAKNPTTAANASYIANDTSNAVYWQNVDLVYATTARTGVVKIGTNIDVANGVISVKTANGNTLGLVKQGTNVKIENGVVSVATANGSTLGLVYQGDYVTIANGKISANKANSTTPGVVYQGNYLTIASDGKISANLANGTTPGVVKQGNYVTIASDGTISANVANGTTPGVVKQGNYVTISNGTISANVANGNTPGVVKQGTNVSIESGAVNVATANGSTLGVVKQGNYITISNGSVSANKANGTTPGVVYQGNYVTIATDGKISANLAKGTTPGVVKQGNYVTIATDGTISANKASGTTPGAVYQGNYVTIGTDGKISANVATTGALGVVKVGTNINVSSGTISVNTANGSTLGLVKQGNYLTISSGTISVNAASTSAVGAVKLNSAINSTAENLAATPKAVSTAYDNCVHLSGDQTVGGIKTFTWDTHIKNNDPYLHFDHAEITKGTKPSATEWGGFWFNDKNGNAVGFHASYVNAEGTTGTQIRAYNYKSGDTAYATLSLVKPLNGDAYAACPTPAAANDNSTKIATTAWVRKATGNTSLNAATATNASVAAKLGTATKGSASQPIYLNKGVPTVCDKAQTSMVPKNGSVYKSANTTYTAECNGWLRVWGSYSLWISGVRYKNTFWSYTSHQYKENMYPVAKGQKYKCNNGADWFTTK